MCLKWRFHRADSSLSLDFTKHFLLACRQYEAFQKPCKTWKQSTCFCHAPTAVEIAENMAALNVNYIAWITTVLGAINSNHTIIFDLNYFLWKLKTSKRQVVSFLLEIKHKVFRFKTRPIPWMPVHKKLRVTSKFLSPTLNFQSHWHLAHHNFGSP